MVRSTWSKARRNRQGKEDEEGLILREERIRIKAGVFWQMLNAGDRLKELSFGCNWQ